MILKISDPRRLIVKKQYDVVVVGGGIAGISAAVSAARNDAKVLLIEKGIILGGLATAGLISWYEPLCDSAGTKMVGGIAEELIKLSMRYGFDDLPDAWINGENAEKKQGRYATHFSPTLFAIALDEYVASNQVELVLDCMATFPVMDGEKCLGIVAETKESRVFYGSKVVIDATGDASLFAQAGLPTVNGQNYMTYIAHGYDKEVIERYWTSENKTVGSLRKWKLAGSNLYGEGHPKGMAKVAGVTAEEITDFVLTGRKMLFESIRQDNRNDRDLLALPMMPQLRTIRHLVGEYNFIALDGEIFNDTIGSCGDFRRDGKGKHYHIPYRSLYTNKCANILAAGRNISASGDGWEVTRVIPVCALTGQAAGVAAAIAAREKGDVRKLDVTNLQDNLQKSGVLFIN